MFRDCHLLFVMETVSCTVIRLLVTISDIMSRIQNLVKHLK